mmetsp:Transcript_12862/g.24432  ORF Transcript_12862/g.24432 Transcript_12862/m.24432 type:complete len:102 (-) Transcript_12862:133-438(-)
MCSDVGSGSRCCAFYSVTGFIFTLWVGVMLQTQPFFIAGVEDAEEARNNAFGAMGMFLACFVLSIIGIWYDSQYKVDPSASEPEGEYQLSNDSVPTYGTAH